MRLLVPGVLGAILGLVYIIVFPIVGLLSLVILSIYRAKAKRVSSGIVE